MKKILFLFFLISLTSFSKSTNPSKIIIIYFSRTGNTQKFANYISELSNEISVFKIEPVTLYPDDYNKTLKIVIEEQNTNARPEIKNALNNVNDYEIILLGYPIWYSHLPNIVINQLEKLDLNGKTIYPFNTHGSSGTGSSISDIKTFAKNATVKDGFPIRAKDISDESSSMEKIKKWMKENFDINNCNFKKINYYLFYFICFLLL